MSLGEHRLLLRTSPEVCQAFRVRRAIVERPRSGYSFADFREPLLMVLSELGLVIWEGQQGGSRRAENGVGITKFCLN